MAVPKPYKLDVPQEFLDWINSRVKTARLVPDLEHPAGEEWNDGTPTAVMEELVDHWKNHYDWRRVEKSINDTYNMFTIDLEENDELITLHFVHHRSERSDAVPLIFSHGWPGNFLEVENLLKLTNPEDPKAQAFHIVAPSIPGFTLSSSPKKPGSMAIAHVASLYHKLMQALGYKNYVAQGGDWGSFITRSLAIQFPESCAAIHLNFIVCLPPSPIRHPIAIFWLLIRWFSEDEKEKLKRMQWWMKSESGYSRIQGTKPQTVSYGLLDSPIGMLAWIREKLQSLAEPDYIWQHDLVVTYTMLYLLSGSASHARIYKENIKTISKSVMEPAFPSSVSVGVSCFPRDVGYAPKWWADCFFPNIVFWKEQAKGGHFASVEVPERLIGDVQEWIEIVRSKGSSQTWEALLKAGSVA
ncbi:epoxide hydrolase [Moniliophthora roreri MCA 2997]|uniref:Epoxide hydrolase n=1 Tax=Moniliophthora roreri (strain MCA 2997) TaxID=1381753 RepID=V2XDI8_MONRO|nr:epoxide hydrolase [Moniliophthora roreri MCA 2997]